MCSLTVEGIDDLVETIGQVFPSRQRLQLRLQHPGLQLDLASLQDLLERTLESGKASVTAGKPVGSVSHQLLAQGRDATAGQHRRFTHSFTQLPAGTAAQYQRAISLLQNGSQRGFLRLLAALVDPG